MKLILSNADILIYYRDKVLSALKPGQLVFVQARIFGPVHETRFVVCFVNHFSKVLTLKFTAGAPLGPAIYLGPTPGNETKGVTVKDGLYAERRWHNVILDSQVVTFDTNVCVFSPL